MNNLNKYDLDWERIIQYITDNLALPEDKVVELLDLKYEITFENYLNERSNQDIFEEVQDIIGKEYEIPIKELG